MRPLVAAEDPQVSFKNAGDCASHGAKGGATARLQVLTDTYPCGGSAGTCWGTVSGSGLRGGWVVSNASTGQAFVFGEVDASESVSEKLELECGGPITSVLAFSETSTGAKFVSPTVDEPSPCG